MGVDDWLFMSSPWPVLGLCAVYYYIVRYAGPAFMKDRPPYDIQKLMIAYNFFQTILSLWVFQKACYFWLSGRYNWLCQPVDYPNSFFFVLRKKWGHLSTLHVVHHGIMPFTAWWGIRFVGGGHTTFCGFLNMGVHVVMYFYYLMSAMGPSVQKYLWWKRYLTTMQLGQFVTFFVHASLPLFIECDFPKIFSFVLLFANFYRQTYTKKSKTGSAKKTDVNGNGAV